MILNKNKKSYLLEQWVYELKKYIKVKLEKTSKPIVILIAWGTASWKTSAVASKINSAFKDSQILSMDNYYMGPSFMKAHSEYNFDQPEALNLDLFFKHLKSLKKAEDVMIPSFDFKNDPIMDAIKIKASRIIIVEWLFALSNKISKLWDIKVFVDLGSHSQILRRLFRDVERTWNSPKDILKYFLWVVSPMHKKYIEPTRDNADFILLNDYIPELESQNAKIKESKLKFKLNWSENHNKDRLSEIIHKLWGSYVWKIEQTDYFFDPNWNYKKTWEVLKIRKIGFWRYFFTYFWPKNGKKAYDDRYTMKFFIDYPTLEAFKSVFPVDWIEVSKIRRNFFIWWVLVILDELENGDKYLVFKFDEKNKRLIILEILEHLWIDARTWIKKSYYELIK